MPSHAQVKIQSFTSKIVVYFVSKSLDSFQDLIWRSKSTLNPNLKTVLECSYKGYQKTQSHHDHFCDNA
jgi:hypothetical protein